MPCYTPLSGWYSKEFGRNGKRLITFSRDQAFSPFTLKLPCQQCTGCRLERVRQWAIRCMHEKQMHENCEFASLTYDPECLPADGSLSTRDVQLFWKRLRKRYGRFRYFASGEYGPSTQRPHYHAVIFGISFPDKKFYKYNDRGEPLYVSAGLDDTWQNGLCVLGDVTFESACYVASYCVDKVTGDRADEHYLRVSPDGVVSEVLPERGWMSKGIGRGWFEKYRDQTYATDSVVMRGIEMRPPRYYDTLFEGIDPSHLERLKLKRRRKALRLINRDKAFQSKKGLPRAIVRHAVAVAKLKKKDGVK